MILAADIGGTKSLFACFEVRNGRLEATCVQRYPSKRFNSLKDAVRTFLIDFSDTLKQSEIESACFCMAGPLIDGRCGLVNLGWSVEAESFRKAFPDIHAIELYNDLQALCLGTTLLPKSDILSLTPDISEVPLKGKNCAVLAPGTGLGEALLLHGHVFPSEGAHCEFGPRSEEEVRLWRFLHRQYGHVSYEQILSGPGLCRLARFLMEERGISDFGSELTPEEVTRRALSGQCDLSKNALRLFVSILGAEAGNLALKSLAVGGVYIGGGIAPNILPLLGDGNLLLSFRDKGRFSCLMESIPVFVILNSRAALYGAALKAARKVYPDTEFTVEPF